MNRKTIKTRTGAYHVTLPIRLVEEFDELLSYKSSRSKMIANLMKNYLEGDQRHIGSMTKKEIIVALMNQVEPVSTEFVMLGILKDAFTYDDGPSSS
jgi:metal-responsive CopG/Arc/MetJ family transcriptional regulator